MQRQNTHRHSCSAPAATTQLPVYFSVRPLAPAPRLLHSIRHTQPPPSAATSTSSSGSSTPTPAFSHTAQRSSRGLQPASAAAGNGCSCYPPAPSCSAAWRPRGGGLRGTSRTAGDAGACSSSSSSSSSNSTSRSSSAVCSSRGHRAPCGGGGCGSFNARLRRRLVAAAAASSSSLHGSEGPAGPSPPPPLAPLLSAAAQLLAPLYRLTLSPLYRLASKYREILQRGTVTLAMLFILRSGMFIPLPGVDLAMLDVNGALSAGERMIRVLYGQAQALPASLFELGISPYINASIVLTVLMVLPTQLAPFQWLTQLKEARKEGKTGEAQITLYMNMIALLFALFLAALKAFQLQPYALFSSGFIPCTALTLVAGSCITNYCANIITSSGIGNGSSLVICIGIVTEYAQTLHSVLVGLEAGLYTGWKLLPLSLGYLGLVVFAVFLSTSLMKLPIVQYSSDVLGTSQDSPASMSYESDFISARHTAKRKATQRSERKEYFPIQLNSQGMMPVIMAGAVYFGFLPKAVSLLGVPALCAHLAAVQSSFLGLLMYGLLIFSLEFVPFGGLNPKETSDYFVQMNVGIKGVIPGEATEQHLKHSLLRCKFWGGLALGSLAVLARLFDLVCQEFLGTTMATTSLLIIVGTAMQTSRQVEVLLERPRVQERLEREQALIQSLRLL